MGATIRSRRLGAELRERRQAARLTTVQVAEELGCSDAKISRIETGKVGVSRSDLRIMLAMYGVTDSEIVDGYVEAARQARSQTRGWWIAYNDAVPREYKDFIALENTASYIRMFTMGVVPGLVQTPEYAREIIQANPAVITPSEVDDLVKVRMDRQTILDRDQPPKLWMILAEGAVRQVVGDPQVMDDQLHHLEHVAHLPNVTLQVLPFTAGAHPAVTGSFSLLEFPNEDPVAYLENMMGALFMGESAQVNSFGSAFDDLRAIALSPADSLKLIEKIRATI